MNFKLWLENNHLINEITSTEIEALPPKDFLWKGDQVFYFNVEGDDCEGKFCYWVFFEDIKKNAYEVEFRRLGNNSKDERKGVGMKVFMAVMYAINQFIKNKNPEFLSWSPAKTKTPNPVTGQIANPEGRKHVYEGFAVKSLFPSYVSVKVNEWIRKDIYQTMFVPKGYPPIPENLTVTSPLQVKKEFLEKIRSLNK